MTQVDTSPAIALAQWRSDRDVLVSAAMCGTHNALHYQAYADRYVWREYVHSQAGAVCSFCDPLTRVAWSAGVDGDE